MSVALPGAGGGGAATVASAVKRRRGSVTQPVPAALSRVGRRADSLASSPAGSVTGGSGAGEAAPPEGTVPPAKMVSPSRLSGTPRRLPYAAPFPTGFEEF